jgi:membrane protease YdiL (CAAX protease family)
VSYDAVQIKRQWTIPEAIAGVVIMGISELGLYMLFRWYAGASYSYFGLALLVHFAGFLGLWMFIRYYVHEPLSSVGLSFNGFGVYCLEGFKWILGITCVVWLVSALLSIEWSADEFNASQIQGFQTRIKTQGILLAAILFFFQAIWISVWGSVAEEIAFRGLLYSALRTKLNIRPAILINAAIFMAAHGQLDAWAFAIGSLAAWLFEKHQTLIPAMVVHVVFNFIRYLNQWFLEVMQVHSQTYFWIGTGISGLLCVATILCCSVRIPAMARH